MKSVFPALPGGPNGVAPAARGLWAKAALALLGIAVAIEPLLFTRLLTLGLSSGDEGVLLAGGRRILHGQIPYRDFFALLPPGPYYLTATTFYLLGQSLASARLLAWFVNLLLLAAVARLAVRLGLGRSGLFLVLLGCAAFGFPYWPILSHHWMATAATVTSALLLWEAGNQDSGRFALASGAAAGAGCLLLQDQGLYWLAFGALALLAAPGRRGAIWGGFLGGAAGVLLPIWASVLLVAPLREVWAQLVLFPIQVYRLLPDNRIPYASGLAENWRSALDLSPSAPWQWASRFSLSLGETAVALIVPLGVVLLAFTLFLRRGNAPARWSASVLLALSSSAAGMAIHRPSIANLAFAFHAVFPGCLWALKEISGSPRWNWSKRPCVFLVAIALLLPALRSACVPFLGWGITFEYPAGRIVTLSGREALAHKMLTAFSTRVRNDHQSLFCYRYASLWYFLLDVDNPTPYDNFAIELQARVCVQGLLTSLRSAPPDWILLDGRFDSKNDPVLRWMGQAGYTARERTPRLVLAAREGAIPSPGPEPGRHPEE